MKLYLISFVVLAALTAVTFAAPSSPEFDHCPEGHVRLGGVCHREDDVTMGENPDVMNPILRRTKRKVSLYTGARTADEIRISNESCIDPTTGSAPYVFGAAITFFEEAQCHVQTKDWPPEAELQDSEEFDFIIVGAGTAGSILANRLSENEDWSVLLLEAGGNPPLESEIPGLGSSLFGSRFDWQYTTVNNGNSNGAHKHGKVKWPRGKMLGGGSSINGMAYVQGNPFAYMSWYRAGNSEWHPDVVKQYFKKAESLQDPDLLKIPAVYNHYGHKGPIVINRFNYTDISVIKNVLSAFEEIGIANVDDLNTAHNLGSGRQVSTVSEGKRVSMATAYLNPIQNRKNLKIVKNAFVTKIVFDGMTARGVEVNHNGNRTRLTIKSKREVIISAGSINTPQLLMLSGIGPTEHLTEKNIKTVIDSPMVGQNLHDHTRVPTLIFADEPDAVKEATRNFETIKYMYDRHGYLASYGTYDDAAAYYSIDSNASYPDYQTVLQVFKKNEETIKIFASSYVKSVENSILKQSVNKSVFLFDTILQVPYSRGNITLKSNDPYEYPLIYYDNYSDRRDLDLQVFAIKKMAEIVNTSYFKSIGGVLGRIDFAACNGFDMGSTEYWECIAVNMATTIYHPICTARMGRNINVSVVDSRLKVHGIQGLRVVDASVMPSMTRGNINGPVIMVAERAADLIKEDYK